MDTKDEKYLEEALSCMDFLNQQIKNIDKFEDRSVFFHNPQIIDGWLKLFKTIDKFDRFDSYIPDDVYILSHAPYLLSLNNLYNRYCDIYFEYAPHLNRLLELYKNNQEEISFSDDILNVLKKNYHSDKPENNFLEEWRKNMNSQIVKAREENLFVIKIIYSCIKLITDAIEKVFKERFPAEEDLIDAIQKDLRVYTECHRENNLKIMNEELNRYYKEHPTDQNTPQLWGEMLRADEKAISMAIKGELSKCDDPKQQHWPGYLKENMEKNVSLLECISDQFYTNYLFDFTSPDFDLVLYRLTKDNLELFCNLILRRNLIQCEMFPELKEQHEEWLKGEEENQKEDYDDNNISSNARQSKLNEIIGILKKGNWKQPATADNIKLLMETILGQDTSLLDNDDESSCEKMWTYVEGGSGDRMVIVPANLAGYFRYENLLDGSPKTISDDMFGKKNNQTNNINKGDPKNASNAFKGVIPFIKKYIDKIIRQV